MGLYQKDSRFKSVKERIESHPIKDPFLIKKILVSRFLHEPITEIPGKFSIDELELYSLGIISVFQTLDLSPFNKKQD